MDTERYYSKGCWLMQPEGDGTSSYLQHYRHPLDADRAARDLNSGGIAHSPAYYASLRRPSDVVLTRGWR